MDKKDLAFSGYECISFDFLGKEAKVIKPNCAPNGSWALKTEYFGAFPEVELELLERGFHIAYIKNENRWAEEYDLERKEAFVRYIPTRFGLRERCVLVGMSCGGLYAVKLAARAPELVSALYLDAPVINLMSCPFGLTGELSSIIDEYVSCTGRGREQMKDYTDHPYNKLDILTDNSLPVILVAGDSDTTVPYGENGRLLAEHYERVGGTIEVHIKKGCEHHPHGLPDPKIIADFLERYSRP